MMTTPHANFFIEDLNFQIRQHLSDSSLNVHRITRLVGMSRTDLHRKLTRMVGMSTSEYVRNIRLNTATKLLLEKPEWTISQISQEVGFNNYCYFSKRFKGYLTPKTII